MVTRESKLKFMYWFTIVTSPTGLLMLLFPEWAISTMGWPPQDILFFGIVASLFCAEAIVAIFGLKQPMKYVPLLMVQLGYKTIWFLGTVIPSIINGTYYMEALLITVVLGLFIIGNLIAIPFKEFIKNE